MLYTRIDFLCNKNFKNQKLSLKIIPFKNTFSNDGQKLNDSAIPCDQKVHYTVKTNPNSQ